MSEKRPEDMTDQELWEHTLMVSDDDGYREEVKEAQERADFHARVAKAQGYPGFRRYKGRE